MLFNSISYMVFLPVVLLVFYIIPPRLRWVWILFASYFFYINWNTHYALLIGFSTVATWVSGNMVAGLKDMKKKIIFIVCLIVNLGILVIFKYMNFVIENINMLIKDGWQIVNPFGTLVLPVGISFYTFQAVGYLVDVYKGEIQPEKNLFQYALFVSFFPQLVAGPIERSKNLLFQIHALDKVRFDWGKVRSGLITMLWGFFQKMVIADNIAVIVDNVFDHWRVYGAIELILAAVCFAIQIYCDFASYSTIAAGTAEMMGVSLMENFNTPYFSLSIKEFWHRWHISLSSWLRDYVYIPLGGNRKGTCRKYLNTVLTFIISGIWHGANWSYIVWGGVHGIYQVLEECVVSPAVKKINKEFKVKTEVFSYKLARAVLTFILVDFAWIFFRAKTVADAFGIIERIFTKWDPWILFNGTLYTLGISTFRFHVLVTALFIVFSVDLIKRRKGLVLSNYLLSQNIWFEWICVLGLFLFIIVFGAYGPSYDTQQFIYFQF